MPRYLIEQYELHTMQYEVEAANEAEAIQKLFNGEGEAVDNSLEFIEVSNDLGLSTEERRELANQLIALGVAVAESVIPSIASIEQIADEP